MHRRRVALLVIVVATLLAGAFLGGTSVDDGGPPSSDRLVRVDAGSYVWPYTSRTRSVEGRTLAINVVVVADADDVRRALVAGDADWGAVAGDADVGESPWRPARGAARFTYVATGDPGAGRWVESTYQLGTGTYLGRRIHVRAYPLRSSDVTALQAHAEYWDWFRLRHTVTGVAAGGRFVERDFRGRPFVGDIRREYHGFEGGGSDGWVSVVEFASAAFLVAPVLPLLGRTRGEAADAALVVALVGLVVGVRAVGVAAEGLLPAANPKLFAAALYPVLVLGPPAAVGLLARGRPPNRAALLAAAGLGTGTLLDLNAVGVSTVPVRLALHRAALAAALALFALGVARANRRTAVFGTVAWLCALAAPLVGVV